MQKTDYSRESMIENGGLLYIILSVQSKLVGIKLTNVFDFSASGKNLMVWAQGVATPFGLDFEYVDHVPKAGYDYHEVSSTGFIAMLLCPSNIDINKVTRWMHLDNIASSKAVETNLLTEQPKATDVYSIYHSIDPYQGATGADSKGPWQYAGAIETYSLEEAFRQSQHGPHVHNWPLDQRSTSVGDIIASRDNNYTTAYLVLDTGVKCLGIFSNHLRTITLADITSSTDMGMAAH